MVYQLTVVTLEWKELLITLCETEEQFRNLTVLDVRREIQRQDPVCGEKEIRLICRCKQLEEDRLLSDYGTQHLDTIHVVERLRGGGGLPGPEGNMGDRDHKNRSMDRLADFETPQEEDNCVLL